MNEKTNAYCVDAEILTVGALKQALNKLDDSMPTSFAGVEGLALHVRPGISGLYAVIDEPGSEALPDWVSDEVLDFIEENNTPEQVP